MVSATDLLGVLRLARSDSAIPTCSQIASGLALLLDRALPKKSNFRAFGLHFGMQIGVANLTQNRILIGHLEKHCFIHFVKGFLLQIYETGKTPLKDCT